MSGPDLRTEALEAFYSELQKACLPGVWSRGVALARAKSVRLEKATAEEILLRVKVADRPVSPKVQLWPGDEDSFCDCEDRVEPCVHVAAAVAALKNGWQVESDEAAPSNSVVRYRLRRAESNLVLDRLLGTDVLRESLVSVVGGISSGRIVRAKVEATQADFAIDQALTGNYDGVLDRHGWEILLPRLREVAEAQPGGLPLGDKPVKIGGIFRFAHAEVHAERGGLRLILVDDPSVTEVFGNGPLLCGDTLRVRASPELPAAERAKLASPGRWFSPAETSALMTTIVPALEKYVEVRILADRIPEVRREPPRMVLRMEAVDALTLNVVPSVEYSSEYVMKDAEAERALQRRLQTELHLTAGVRAQFRGEAAIEFVRKTSAMREVDVRGNGRAAFSTSVNLVGDLSLDGEDFRLSFRSADGKSASPDAVFDAFANGAHSVALTEGGFAALPTDWLTKFAPALQRLLALRGLHGRKLPAYARPELFSLADEMGIALAPGLERMKAKLGNAEELPSAPLPADLRAELRGYQKTGVNWLNFLTDAGMGAVLADDMGLGKTLQAICVIGTRALVIAPTSVLFAWKAQIAQFRPGLRVNLYYGASRRFDEDADVTLTSYGLLRSESERWQSAEWDLIVLDEAQTIKNPESQVAQAAHRLRAKARLTLSGTPVENRLDDLWSQFQFLNPGLLGSRREFQEEFAQPIARGDARATLRFRARIRPFILRRLKRDVAPELPPRTEATLHCELTAQERTLYDALLVTARKEVLAELEAGASAFGALEQLLRLRQACAHPALVPGQSSATSAKLELLVESLEKSLALGHRALVFSQWTSFLDLIEPRLRSEGITFTRLDGGTRDRESVVREFQAPTGPAVMLLSLKAGGVGLTLTAADHVYLMDSWWNPAVEDQAADRAHRIGQENAVFIYRLITKDTVEERILALQERKRALASAAIDGGSAASGTISREDLIELLRE